jgi:predicted nucleic acid-binding protein
MIVIDASVVVKFYVDEENSDRAIEVFESNEVFFAPAHMLAEVFYTFIKHVRDKRISSDVIKLAQIAIPGSFVSVSLEDIMPLAVEMSLETGSSVYDALYVAVAESRFGLLITADKKLVQAFRNSPWKNRIQALESWKKLKQ